MFRIDSVNISYIFCNTLLQSLHVYDEFLIKKGAYIEDNNIALFYYEQHNIAKWQKKFLTFCRNTFAIILPEIYFSKENR